MIAQKILPLAHHAAEDHATQPMDATYAKLNDMYGTEDLLDPVRTPQERHMESRTEARTA
ncbi:MAG: hypothetical protein JWM03_1450 [Rhodocyclales bacterium]|nr:hypothetical protein [Rhodocyclales bacterium]